MLVMNRSNSFVNSLKWWPLQGHNNNNNNNNINTNNNNNCSSQNNLHTHAHQLHQNNNNSKTCNFGSSVAVQKLRESKWFKLDERRIFCAVVECGFIVEVRADNADNDKARLLKHNAQAYAAADMSNMHGSNADDDDDSFIFGQDENVRPMASSWFGVVLCKTAKDNKPKPETIEIYTVKIRENGTFKMLRLPLEDIWKNGWELRINNFADKEKSPHNEKDIRNQVSFARKAKQSLWNNNKHFAYWCRYGCRQQDVRKRQMSECVKWGSVGMNAGMLLVMNKQKSLSASK